MKRGTSTSTGEEVARSEADDDETVTFDSLPWYGITEAQRGVVIGQRTITADGNVRRAKGVRVKEFEGSGSANNRKSNGNIVGIMTVISSME